MNPSRRQLLTGRIARPAPEFRPPWTTETNLAAACTRCGDCARACPQGIIDLSAGLPRIRFDGRDCTFCGECAAACQTGAFGDTAATPWPVTVALGAGCLMPAGIACRLCTDACDRGALGFDMALRPVGGIAVVADACTGCGACLPVCPTGRLTLHDARMTEAA